MALQHVSMQVLMPIMVISMHAVFKMMEVDNAFMCTQRQLDVIFDKNNDWKT